MYEISIALTFFSRVESPPVEENIPLTTQNPPDIENKPRVLFTGLISIKDFAKVSKCACLY